MSFNIIDLNTWKRRAHYRHYMDKVRCTYSVTINVEVENLVGRIKSLGLKTYPVQIYMIAKAVNLFPEFKMAVDSQGRLGYWDIADPSYTIFNQAAETFSSIYTPFNHDFARFYDKCSQDIEIYRNSTELFPQKDMPANLFTVSSLPWLNFTGFNLNVFGEGDYLVPIFTIGQYLEQNGRKQMPISIQVHHAVCDGWHVGRFVEALRNMAVHTDWLG